MKLKHIIATLSLAAVMAVGVGAVAGGAHQEAKSAKADSVSGSLIAKFDNPATWATDGAKLSAYITDDTHNYWTVPQVMSSGKAMYKLDYTIDFTPTKLIFVRLNPAASEGSWGQKYNQTGDLGWNEATYIGDGWDNQSCSQWTLSALVRSNTVESFGTKQVLSTIGINADGNPEVSGVVSLAKDEEFKILSGDNVWVGYYGCPDAIDSCFSGGSKTSNSSELPNIKCEKAGSYEFFYDTEAKKVWLTRQDIVDADGWAEYFLNHVVCDETSATLPTGWSDAASAYAALSGDAKDYVYGADADEDGDNVARALARYEVAVARHSSLTKFVVDRNNNVRRAISIASVPTSLVSENSTAITIVVVVAMISVSAIAGYFLIRKRKEN